MAHGGARKGAGRKKGSQTKRTQEIIAVASAQGISPLEVMLDNMRFAHAQAAELLTKVATGNEPLDANLEDILKLRSVAQSCASDAAPYLHPRLANVQHSGDADNPIAIIATTPDPDAWADTFCTPDNDDKAEAA